MADHVIERANIINVNVGILGHVDSGKTSLVKALSTLLSTAALDKNPQSQQRGITLDLGFSAFTLPMPEHLAESAGPEKDLLQFTLVDCPGHASLIRTIIGGAQIIDMMILVVDANKGIQTQTAECIVIGEITTDKLIIVLNKCDLLPAEERELRIAKMTNKLRKVFATTKFATSPIIATSAAVGGEKVASVGLKCATEKNSAKRDGTTMILDNTQGVSELVELIRSSIEIPRRNFSGPLYFAIDHCFSIKGHGTIVTGTVLSGSVSLNSTIEIPHLQIQRKVKSMQMFRKSVRTAGQGDRVGLCVTNLDPTSIERSIAISPGSLTLMSTVICLVKKVRYFRQACKSNSKFHISIGHTTVAATVAFYGAEEISILKEKDKSQAPVQAELHEIKADKMTSESNKNSEVRQLNKTGSGDDEMKSKTDTGHSSNKKNKLPRTDIRQSALNAIYHNGFPAIDYPWDTDFEYQDVLKGQEDIRYGAEPAQWAVLQFQRPVFCPIGSLIIGSRLDTFSTAVEKEEKDGLNKTSSSQAGQCRLAFYGPIKESVAIQDVEKIKVYHWKQKIAKVFKITDFKNGLCCELIGCNLVKEGGSMLNFIGLKIETERGHLGIITGPYGSGGSFKVKFRDPVPILTGSILTLRFKRYLHDKLKVMAQQGLDEYAQEKAAAIAAMMPFDEENYNEINGIKKSNRQLKAEKKSALASKNGAQEISISDGPIPLVTPSPSSSQNQNKSDDDKILQLMANKTVKMTEEKSHADPITEVNRVVSTQSTLTERHVDPVPLIPDIPTPRETTIVPRTDGPPREDEKDSRNPFRVGLIESFKEDLTASTFIAIVSGAFRMEENIKTHAGGAVRLQGYQAVCGTLIGPFAKMGKCKISFTTNLNLSVGAPVEIDFKP